MPPARMIFAENFHAASGVPGATDAPSVSKSPRRRRTLPVPNGTPPVFAGTSTERPALKIFAEMENFCLQQQRYRAVAIGWANHLPAGGSESRCRHSASRKNL